MRKLGAIASFISVMVLLSSPYFLLTGASSYTVSFLLCGLVATVFGMLFRSAELKIQFAVGFYIFITLCLTSASIGVFFSLSIGKALVAFIAISIGGAVVLTVGGFIMGRRFFPDLFKPTSGEQDGESDG